MADPKRPREAHLASTPIRDLGLEIAGTRLEPIIDAFRRELDRTGIRKVAPRFYLSTEWGVPWGTVSIAIPFYLARPDLTDLHSQEVGHVEGMSRGDILRYLRHEMGHVVNYAYKLFDTEDWVMQFGSITQPYLEDYRPEPFSRRYVRHLPGWYAQKHPDEDWAETFAVWMTPRFDWRGEYAGWATVQRKLEYVERTIRALAERDPPVTSQELDEDVGQLPYTLEQFYGSLRGQKAEFPHGLDGALKAIFEDIDETEGAAASDRKPASTLIRRLEKQLIADIYRWTGHFPEQCRTLLRHLADRADQLQQVYPERRENSATVGLTTLVTALAMNYVHKGTYLP